MIYDSMRAHQSAMTHLKAMPPADRAYAITAARDAGLSAELIARAAGVHPSTVRRYVARWRAEVAR